MVAFSKRVDKGLCYHCVRQHYTAHSTRHFFGTPVTLLVFSGLLVSAMS